MLPLRLESCPHCEVTKPYLAYRTDLETGDERYGTRVWEFYSCSTCDGVIMLEQLTHGRHRIWPAHQVVAEELPDRAQQFLTQAIASRSAPAGAVVLAASAVDAMLKAKGLTAGTLYNRIKQAAENHLITPEMALWAHEVRLDANDQRHADQEAPLPDAADASKSIQFAQALGQFLFVLPALVTRGREKVVSPTTV